MAVIISTETSCLVYSRASGRDSIRVCTFLSESVHGGRIPFMSVPFSLKASGLHLLFPVHGEGGLVYSLSAGLPIDTV